MIDGDLSQIFAESFLYTIFNSHTSYSISDYPRVNSQPALSLPLFTSVPTFNARWKMQKGTMLSKLANANHRVDFHSRKSLLTLIYKNDQAIFDKI